LRDLTGREQREIWGFERALFVEPHISDRRRTERQRAAAATERPET
jgi:hypothetical protein